MLVVIIRALILFTLVVIVMRVMGKRQIGQLQPYELAVTIMISELASVPMQNTGIPLLYGIIPILLLLSFQVFLSILSMKSVKARECICGRPSVVIENGWIKTEELRKLRMNVNDLLEQLRMAGYANIADVEFALLETNGKFSVVPKSQKRPLCPADIGLPTHYEGLSYPLVLDGNVEIHRLHGMGLNLEWLEGELRKLGIDRPSDVLLACLDTSGRLYCQPRGERKKDRA